MFQKGQSGNPKGRRPGSGKHADLRTALEKHRMDLIDKVVSLALDGDTTALKLCLERLCPPIKTRDEPVRIPMPLNAALSERGNLIIQAMGDGELPPDTAAQLLQALAHQARLVEVEELEARIQALESKNA